MTKEVKDSKKFKGTGIDLSIVEDVFSYKYSVGDMGPPFPLATLGFYRSAIERTFGKDLVAVAWNDEDVSEALRKVAVRNDELSRAFGVTLHSDPLEGRLRSHAGRFPAVFTLPDLGMEILMIHRQQGLVSSEKAPKFLSYFENYKFPARKPRPKSNIDPLDLVEWDEKTIQVRRDLLFFLDKVWWFAKRKLPYKRSYLFWGPPGNGKTSAIRAISRKLGANPEIFDFSATYRAPDSAFRGFMRHGDPELEVNETEIDPEDKYEEKKINVVHRLIVLEDVDRLFPKNGAPGTSVSLQCMLNELDGDYRQSGRIVIATANHPEYLDAKVFARPGRFDRLVEFKNPNTEVARRYLTRIFAQEERISKDLLDEAAKKLEGMSFASYEKLLSTSAIEAAERQREKSGEQDFWIEDTDLTRAIEVVRSEKPSVAQSYDNPAE